jgi:hypothetical protein
MVESMTFENFIKARLVSFVLDETVSDPSIISQLAVAQCLANRVNAGWCGSDWLSVIDSAHEVSGTVYENRATINMRDIQFRDLLRRIDDVYYGSAESMIGVDNGEGETVEPLYYCVGNNINRQWFTDNILSFPDAHRMVAKVGALMFFM